MKRFNPIVNQYELWLSDIPEIMGNHVLHGFRPILIVSNNASNAYSPNVTAVPLTSRMNKRYLPTHVHLQEQGLHKNSLALCEQIITLDKYHLKHRIGYISNECDRLAVQQALAVHLGITTA